MTVKMQHYVPRFMLKNFSTQKKEEYIINCFDKMENRSFPVNVRRIAGENFFYDIKKGEIQKLEEELANFEGRAAKVIKKILKKKKISKLIQNEKETLSLFIAVQYLRTREHRETIKDFITQLAERLSMEVLSDELETQIEDIKTEKGIKEFHVRDIIERTNEFANYIFNMKWTLFVNQTKMPFITSDNPVDLYGDKKFNPLGKRGISSRGIQLNLPISPELCLKVCDPEAFKLAPPRYRVKDEGYVMYENGIQVAYSTRHIFSVGKDFKFVKDFLKDNTFFKDPDRKRIVFE